MTEEIQECYRILDLDPSASPEAVKEAWRDLMKVWHPDRFPDDPKFQQKANEKTKQISDAYQRIRAYLSGNYTESRASANARAAEGQAEQAGEAAAAERRQEEERQREEAWRREDERQSAEAQRAETECRGRAEEEQAALHSRGQAAPRHWLWTAISVLFLLAMLLKYASAGWQWLWKPSRAASARKAQASEKANVESSRLAEDVATVPLLDYEKAKAEYDRLAEDVAAVALSDYSGGEAWRRLKELAATGQKAVRTREGTLAYQEAAKSWPVAYEEAERAAKESAQDGNAFSALLVLAVYGEKQNWGEFSKWASLRDQLLKEQKSEWQEKYAAEFQREQALANQDVPFHMDMVGRLYDTGVGVAKDLGAAVRWFRKAAEAGFVGGQVNLGRMYENGDGVEKDNAEALKWYRKAAEAGFVGGQVNLGRMYDNGQGVEKDNAEALKWYRKAAEQENPRAQLVLGMCYESGTGVAGDVAEAILWYRKAAANGDAEARQHLKRLGQN